MTDKAGSLPSPLQTDGIALLSGGCSMTHGKCLGCLRPLFGGQVYIAERFAIQLIPEKKKSSAVERGEMGRIHLPNCWGTGKGLQKVVSNMTVY